MKCGDDIAWFAGPWKVGARIGTGRRGHFSVVVKRCGGEKCKLWGGSRGGGGGGGCGEDVVGICWRRRKTGSKDEEWSGRNISRTRGVTKAGSFAVWRYFSGAMVEGTAEVGVRKRSWVFGPLSRVTVLDQL